MYNAHSNEVESSYNAPEELKRLPRWMGTRFERRPSEAGKTDKPPYRVNGTGAPVKADKRNPANYATFEEAAAALERGAVDAIGFVFTEADEFILIDLDGAVDERGQLTRTAEKIVGAFPTYWEVSQSGRGLHGIARAEKPGPRCANREKGIELYDGRTGARFAVITGDKLATSADGVTECRDATNVLYSWAFGDSAKKRRARGQRPRTGLAPLADDKLLERARRSKDGPAFRRLFDEGDITGYASASEADYALINRLLFWCAGDLERVEALFKRSALYRSSDKHGGYVALSAANAFESYTGRYYEPRAVREEPTPEREDVLTPYLRLLAAPSEWTGPKGASAYKTFAAVVLDALKHGIKTGAKDLRIGSDVRSMAELAGVSHATLCKSTLPYLVKDLKRMRWHKGKPRGDKSGTFILPLPKVPQDFTNKDTGSPCGLFIGEGVSESLNALAQFIRMRSGRSKFAKVSRLGPVAMFCMIALYLRGKGGRRGLSLDELADALGRRKDNVRRAMRRVVSTGIAEEPERDRYILAADFWEQYERELADSGILDAEQRQRMRHEEDRRERDERLKSWREARRNVVKLPKRRAKKPSWGTKKEAASDADLLPLAKRCDPEEEYRRQRELEARGIKAEPGSREEYRARRREREESDERQAEYDCMVERTMQRLARSDEERRKRPRSGEGGGA